MKKLLLVALSFSNLVCSGDSINLEASGDSRVFGKVSGSVTMSSPVHVHVSSMGKSEEVKKEDRAVLRTLISIPEIRRNMFNRFLEITHENCSSLLTFATNPELEPTFKAYQDGVYVKWKSSQSVDNLLELLIKFDGITKFKIEVESDSSHVDYARFISQTVMGYEQLQELSLVGCGLSDEGMLAIIESIMIPEKIVAIDLRGNNISSEIHDRVLSTLPRVERLVGLERSPLKSDPFCLTIPEIARGHESMYRKFLEGFLIYRPELGSDRGKIELPIRSILNPLDGAFDLSNCGDVGRFLSISTGYKKSKVAINNDKLEVWIAPRFSLQNSSRLHRGIDWESWLGIFFTSGNLENLDCYDYHTRIEDAQLLSSNLYNFWSQSKFNNGFEYDESYEEDDSMSRIKSIIMGELDKHKKKKYQKVSTHESFSASEGLLQIPLLLGNFQLRF
ncbi:MAG TPA: hypothetical protein DCP55_03595 [Chitinophagaceae bacterium]|nr:hypothetical protein [Chitinophagaceae bacterium]